MAYHPPGAIPCPGPLEVNSAHLPLTNSYTTHTNTTHPHTRTTKSDSFFSFVVVVSTKRGVQSRRGLGRGRSSQFWTNGCGPGRSGIGLAHGNSVFSLHWPAEREGRRREGGGFREGCFFFFSFEPDGRRGGYFYISTLGSFICLFFPAVSSSLSLSAFLSLSLCLCLCLSLYLSLSHSSLFLSFVLLSSLPSLY